MFCWNLRFEQRDKARIGLHVVICSTRFTLKHSTSKHTFCFRSKCHRVDEQCTCLRVWNKQKTHTHTHTRARTHTHTHAPNASDWKKRKMAPSLWTLCSWPAQPRSLIVSRFLANHVVSPFSLPPFGTCAPLCLTSLCNPTTPIHLLGNPHTSFQSLMVSRLTRVQVVLLTWCVWDDALEERSCCLHESCTLKLWDVTAKRINSGVGHPSEFCALKKRTAKNAKMGTPMRLMHVAFVSLQSSASAQSQTHHNLVWECHFQHAPKPLSKLMVKRWGLRCCAIGLRRKCLAYTSFVQFSIACNANESRGWSPDFILFRTFASVSVPGGVQTTNQPNQLMVIAFRLRLQQTEDLFIAGGVRFRLQLRCASLGGGGSAAALRLQLGAQVRGKKKRRVGISLGGSDFNFGFSFEQPNSAGGGWFSDALRLRVGPKAGGAVRVGFLCAWGSGQILTSVSASKRKPRAGSLAFWLWLTSQGVGVKGWMGVRLHFDVDFDFPPDVFGKQPTKPLQCTSTSVSTWRGVRVKTLDC